VGGVISRSRHHEAHVSAEQSKEKADTRFPGSHEDQGRPSGPEATPPKGSSARRGVAEVERLADTKLQPQERVRCAADFRRAFRKGLRLDGALFTLLAAENGLELGRLGLATSRRVGGAVARNRAKRLLRESFRRNKTETIRGLDLVLVPKREIGGKALGDVEAEYRSRLIRLQKRRR
jgi:ribonuclease P protein component